MQYLRLRESIRICRYRSRNWKK